MLRLVDVWKSYPSKGGRHHVLESATLDFPPGRNTALIGPNGAGKSTLMRLLSGAELPDRGRVERQATVSWPLGFSGGLHRSLSGRENVSFVSRIYDRDYREMADFVEDFAEIGKAMKNPVGTYSAGMRARVAFGISMAIEFDYYLIDEVIAVGDANFRMKCQQVLNEKLKDSTVILVSHAPALMRDFCTSGVVLEEKRLRHFDDVDVAIDYHEERMTAA